MARLEELVAEKIRRIETAPQAWIDRTSATSLTLLEEILGIFSQMDQVGGNLATTDANYARIARIGQIIGEVFEGDQYLAATAEYALAFNQQLATNNAIFTEVLGDAFTAESRFARAVQLNQRNAVQMLSGDVVTRNFSAELLALLNDSVGTQTEYQRALRGLTAYVVGDAQTVATLESYGTRIVYDAFSVADRLYTTNVSQEYGIEWYRYSGGLINTSRQFCRCRDGHIYHIDEITRWGLTNYTGCGTTSAGHWDGRNTATNRDNITALLGGYNCRHILIPIAESEVPESVKAAPRYSSVT